MPVEVDLTWFKPLPKQQGFLDSVAQECVYAGGVGSGKTVSGCFKVLKTAINYPGTNILIGRQTYRALEDTTKRVLLDGDDKPPIIPAELIKHRSEQDNTVTLKNGTTLLFRALEPHNLEKLLSLNLGAAYVDETTETVRAAWSTLIGRLRHPKGPGQIWGTTNPNGHDWTWSLMHPDGTEFDASREMFIAPTHENHHLPAKYVAHLMGQPKEWVKRFVLCSFDSASGQIWDDYDRRIHVVPHRELPGHWRRWEALDYGWRNPTCVLWFAMDNDGNVWVYDEHYEPEMKVAQHALAIKHKRSGRAFPAIQADPSVFAKGFDDRSIADEYSKNGIVLSPASNDVSHGLEQVAWYMKPREGEEFPALHPLYEVETGSPRVFISERCKNLIREIPEYRWKDLSLTREQNENQPEEPRKKDDHACDTLKYGLAKLPRPHLPKVRDPDEIDAPADSFGLIDVTF